MGMKARLCATAPIAAIIVALACSATNNAGGGGPSGPFTPCLANGLDMGGAQDQCSTCLEGMCQTEGRNFQNQCAGYIACICTDGQAPDSATLKQCAPMLSDQMCGRAVGALDSCEERKCNAACVAPDAAIDVEAGPVNDVATDVVTDAATDGDAGSATITLYCSNGTGTMMECDQQQLPPSSEQAAAQGCGQVGGTAGNGCQTQGLAGCCKLPTTENCYYDPAALQQRQAMCKNAGGSWSATP